MILLAVLRSPVVRARAAFAALWLHLLLAPQWLGGIYPWAVVVTSVTAVIALGLSLWAFRVGPNRVLTVLIAALVVGLVWTAVQVLPLPCELVAWLHPTARAHAHSTGALIGQTLSCTLSLDPGATRVEVLKGTALLCTALAAARIALAGQRVVVLSAVGASAVLMALVALGHLAADATRVFGIYQPPSGLSHALLAPLMNLNHLGGFLVLGAPVMLGVASGTRDRERMAALLASAVLILLALILTLSRGAIIMGVLGCLAFSGWSWWAARQRGLARVWAIGFAAACGFAAAGYLAIDAVVAEFTGGGLEKLSLHRHMLEVLPEQPLVGVGRGAFSAAFLPFSAGPVRQAYAESLPLQWAFEWGVPIALTLGLALAWVLLQGLKKACSPAARGAGVGVVCLAIQNLGDYNLELSGVAVVAVACLAGLVPRPSGTRSRRAGGAGVRSRRAAGAGARSRLRSQAAWAVVPLASVIIAALGPAVLGTGTHQYHRRLSWLLEAERVEAFDALMAEAMHAHPAEPNLLALGATQAVRQKRPDAFRWLNRAMTLSPGWGAPRALAAAALWNMRRYDQALMELREAGSRDWRAAYQLLCTLVGRDAAVLPKALPEGANRARLVQIVQKCIRADTPHADAIDAWQLEAFPELDEPYLRSAERSARAGEHATAVDLLREALSVDPTRAALWAALIRAHTWAAADARALEVCAEAQRHVGERESVLEACARAYARADQAPAMRAAVARLRARTAGDPVGLARAMRLLGELERALGNLPLAVRAFDRAYAYLDEPADLLRVAEAAEALRDLPRALRAYGEACRRRPELTRACEGRLRLETRPFANGSAGVGVTLP